MAPVRTVCVYCGSGFGGDPAFTAAAVTLGKALAEAGAGTVYLAGRPAALADDLRAAGVTGFLHAGGDLLAFLKDALRRATPA